MSVHTPLRALALITTSSLAISCSPSDSPAVVETEDPVVTTVVLTPGTIQFDALGSTTNLSAEAHDQNGAVMTSAAFSWTTSDPTIASVGASGGVTAEDNGAATITATAGGISATAAVTVSQVVSTVVVAPNPVQIDALGSMVNLSAHALDSNGFAVLSETFSWMTSDPTIANVDLSGSVTAVDNGAVTVTATASGIDGNVAVIVAQVAAIVAVTPDAVTVTVGGSTDLVAEVQDANFNPMPGASGTWSTSDAAVATVTSGGQVSGIAEGTATVSFDASGVSGSSAITVTGSLPPVGISIDFETYASGAPVCGNSPSCPVSNQWSAWGVVFDFVDVSAGGGLGIPTIQGAIGARMLANDRSGSSFLTGSHLMIFSVGFDSVDFDLRWTTGAGIPPTITVYDASGVVVPSAIVDRAAAPLGAATQENISILSPVPIGRIKIGPDSRVMWVDNLVY